MNVFQVPQDLEKPWVLVRAHEKDVLESISAKISTVPFAGDTRASMRSLFKMACVLRPELYLRAREAGATSHGGTSKTDSF